jgi:hypothetical protein
LDIEGKGGFKPYSYDNISTDPKGTLNPTTGEYVAPAAVDLSGNTEQMEFEVTDHFGAKASTLVTVYKPVRMSPAAVTVDVGTEVNFSVSGGVPNYELFVDEESKGTTSGNWAYVFSDPGTKTVVAEDSIGNRAVSIVTVTDELGIEVGRYWVEEGDSLPLIAFNSSGDHVFSIIGATSTPTGSISDATSNPASYDAPADIDDDGLVVEIQLLDNSDGETATVNIYVLEDPPLELTFPTQIEVVAGSSETSLTVNGGVPFDDPDTPYRFWLEGAGTLNPHPVHGNKIQYTPPDFVPSQSPCVWVEDAVGQRSCATVIVLPS